MAPFHLDATSLGKSLTSAARTPREEKPLWRRENVNNTIKGQYSKKPNLTLWHHSATGARPSQVLLQAIFGPALPNVDRSHQAVLPVVAAEIGAEPGVVPGTRVEGKHFK